MFTPASSFVLAFACLVNFVVATSQVQLNGRSYSIQQIISRDFAIIGGGATGTYSAVRLQDLNNSIAIVEKEAQLGGHTYTYIDPNTGSGVEAGVQVFHNNSLVHQYFSRFNISLGPPIFRPVSDGTQFYDLETGALTNYTAPSNAAFGAAVAKYAAQIAKYPEIANGLNPSYPVADDLLLPFGDFIAKYGVADIVHTCAGINEGLGSFLNQTSLYVFASFNIDLIQGLSNFVTTANHDNSALYEKALTSIGQSNILLSSTVVATDRTGPLANVLVRGPRGLTLIQAKKIVNTIPPKTDNLVGWDLDDTECGLFEQFDNSAYYTVIVNNTGIPSNFSVSNIGLSSSNYNLAALPASYGASQTLVPGLITVTYGSPNALPENQVKISILQELRQLASVNGFIVPSGGPEIVNFQNHAPFRLTVPAEAIKNGFYEQLYGLQGHLKTYYTGAAFYTHDSSFLWRFTEALLPTFTP